MAVQPVEGTPSTVIAHEVEAEPVDVAALVWDAAEPILGGWEGPHVRLAVEPGVGTIVTDRNRLLAVLSRLAEDAREAVRAAGRTAWVDGIEMGARLVDGCRLLLWVEDRGAGVAAGTVLGLAIARQVVEALGGTVRLESRQGEGRRVTIAFPLTRA
ncbi:MAG TPA: ATP-binding protein [Vicinamibacteria bacterium]|nr:ATP-binding protein [Vicinamibacteria bacterium]